MPYRNVAARELADLLSVLSHPCRVQIIEELRSEERNVNSLQELLGISHSGVSQHLALLRTRKLLKERRAGRHVYYRLVDPGVAEWLRQGVVFLERMAEGAFDQKSMLHQAMHQWENPQITPNQIADDSASVPATLSNPVPPPMIDGSVEQQPARDGSSFDRPETVIGIKIKEAPQ